MKKKILIKLGGSSLENPATVRELVALTSGYRKKNYDIILVHGGGPAINQELTRRGIEWKFINGQRQTTPQMMDVIEEVLAKQINSMLVSVLLAAEIPAVGISGIQDKTLLCSQANSELMQVGKVESVNTAALEKILQLELGPTPVIAPLGAGLHGEKYNINADWAAAKIAIALQAEKLIFLTDQNGILDQDKQLVHRVTPQLINKMIEAEAISGGMYTKVMTMMTALSAGIPQVRVLNANVASQLLNNDEIGTLLSNDLPPARKEVTEWNQKLN
ncbi:MAG TPA: acetylglutamate kinase [Pseudobdellovibrionaceae bacterium]|jgi:acetylglutamate kinase